MIRTKFILVAGLFLVLNCHVVRAQKTSYKMMTLLQGNRIFCENWELIPRMVMLGH